MKLAVTAATILLVLGFAASTEPECPFVPEACDSGGRMLKKTNKKPIDLGCCESLPTGGGLGNFCVSGGGMTVLFETGAIPDRIWCCPKDCHFLEEKCTEIFGKGGDCIAVETPPAFTSKTVIGQIGQASEDGGVYCCPGDAFLLPE